MFGSQEGEMPGTMKVTALARNRLDGEPVPEDLRILLENAEDLFELTGLRFHARKDWAPWLDTSHLSARERADPGVAAALRATAEVCEMVAFVAAEEDGHYLGYWRGPEGRPVAGCPVVVLDRDGEFGVCAGSNLAQAVLSRVCGEERFLELQEFLGSLGLPADFATQQDIPYPDVELPPDALHRQLCRQYRAAG
jgi:hypothetical protein